ncbi:serine hydrolase domain-containing protein, partial [Streptomyces zinciresistens]|uniref:serine hydrolase domain-containing protein n=1 Tax=Streptomyces zinciresistens TaxID=1073330 RepID=UPI0005C1ED3D
MPSLAQTYGCRRGGSRALSAPRLRGDTPERAGLDPEEIRRLVREVRGLTAGPRPWAAGAVLVAGRGPCLAVEEATGWAVRYAGWDEETDAPVELPPGARVPATAATPFDLASLTKLFTSVAAVQQIERGTLGIDARVGAYLPDFRAAARHDVTVRQLLTHTSGLRPELPLHDCPDAGSRLERLRAEAPVGVPGAFCYSDLNMLLLQHVLERITGRALDVLVRDGITRPLGMAATRFGPCPGAAATEDQRRPWAKADRGMLRGSVHDENAWALGGVAGHAGLFSTGRDLAVFCRALLSGGAYGPARILGPDFVELLLTPPGLGFAVDQPWFMGELAGRGAAGHTGFTGTSLVLDPPTDTFLVLL